MIGKIFIVVVWGTAILFSLYAAIIIYDLFADGKGTGGAVSLLTGLISAALLASNGAHILVIMFLTPMAVWFVARFFDSSLRDDDDSEFEDNEPTQSPFSEAMLEAIIINQVARSLDKKIENARNGGNNGPNMHI